jgi:hypothetical protein
MRSLTLSKSLTRVCAAVLMLLVPAVCPASIARRMSLSELTGLSTVIAIGRCEEARSHWNPTHTQIVTRARYAVANTVKGTLPAEITVETLGGVVDGVGMYVPGVPSFHPGADEVLFLVRSGTGSYRVVGMAQGQFRISIVDSRTIVSRELRGLELLGAPDRRLADGKALSSLMREVRSALR